MCVLVKGTCSIAISRDFSGVPCRIVKSRRRDVALRTSVGQESGGDADDEGTDYDESATIHSLPMTRSYISRYRYQGDQHGERCE